jgi:hypothetical protein
MDLQGKFTFLKGLCALIPDHPEEADRYLNINRKKQEQRKTEL